MPSLSLFLFLFVEASAGDLGLPSIPEAVQLLQLETIRGLKQTILEKEDENRRLEQMIRSVNMEKEAVTLNITTMKEKMVRMISERDSVIGEMEKAAIEKENVMVMDQNALRMVVMGSEKIQMRE